jgi:hypothetical protein
MTNKPFEVQDDAIILNGVELQVTQQGDLTVNDSPIFGGGDPVNIVADNGTQSAEWIFNSDSSLSLPTGGAIEFVGADVGGSWTGLTNGVSGEPVSIMNKCADEAYLGQMLSAVSVVNNVPTKGRIRINTSDLTEEQFHIWGFEPDGRFVFPR